MMIEHYDAGVGRGPTVWEWEIYDGVHALQISKGTTRGAERKAYQAGRQEITRIIERQAAERKATTK